jgi:putative salt-induced outer membrane protein YdiY
MKSSRITCSAATLALLLAGAISGRSDDAAATAAPPAAATGTNAVVPAPPPPKWESSLAIGATLTSGNSDSLMATINFLTDRKTANNELQIGAAGGYGYTKAPGQTTNTVNANFYGGFIQNNWSFTERLYGYARLDGRHDAIAQIDYRLPLGAGLGYFLIRSKPADLSFELGPGYMWQKVAGVSDQFATLRVAQQYRQELSDRARLRESVEWLPQVDRFNNYVLNASVALESDLTKDKRCNMSLTLLDTFNNIPAPGLQKNDLKLVAAVGCKF